MKPELKAIKIPTFLQQRYFWQALFGLFFIIIVIYFIRNEKLELVNVKNTLYNSNIWIILLGISFTLLYIFLQGWLYVQSFKSVGKKIPILPAVNLFLKRNLIGVLIPGGTFSSLAFFNSDLNKNKLTKTQQYIGSYVFGLASTISIIIIAIPAFVLLALRNQLNVIEIVSFVVLAALIVLLAVGLYLITKGNKGFLYRILLKYKPEWVNFLEDLTVQDVDIKYVGYSCFVSVLIEIVGVIHLYIALLALNAIPLFSAALIGYVVMVVVMSFSPFLRGLGAIELSVTYILVQFGYISSLAVSATLLFRMFEFWLPLFASLFVFIFKKDNLILRLVPSVLLLFLGIINIFSVLTPAIPSRIAFISDLLPQNIIHFTNISVLFIGSATIILSVYLFLGSKNAWRIALFFSFLSVFGHLLKAIDYEESIASVVVFIALVLTRKSYFIKHSLDKQIKRIRTFIIGIVVLVLYGVFGFYFLEKVHFHQNFTLEKSFISFLQTYTGDIGIIPQTQFAREFIFSIQFATAALVIFFLWVFILPPKSKIISQEEARIAAQDIIKKSGISSLDYFKAYFDKLFFFSTAQTGFISYKIVDNYAIVLENPVSENKEGMIRLIDEFKDFCSKEGLGLFFYRIPKKSRDIYSTLHFHSVLIGQEGIVNLEHFTLEGKEKSSLRNALNKINKAGFVSHIYEPPLKDGLIQKLENVSTHWLSANNITEVGFTQGIFSKPEIKATTVITLENNEEKIVAFINLLPDRNGVEGTYDLIRKTNDAPNGVIDYLIIETFKYFIGQGYKYVNLGLAALSGFAFKSFIHKK